MKNFEDMRGRIRRFYPDILIHCYQRTSNGGVLFYCISDFLVCYVILCLAAEKFHVCLVKVCLMYDHIHLVIKASKKGELSGFMQYFLSWLSREFGNTRHVKGRLFESPFGSALKVGAKKGRTTLIYVDNNPVERGLCKSAVEYRWNFLAYAFSPNPFSKRLQLRTASKGLRRYIAIVKDRHAHKKHLPYIMLKRMFSSLNSNEREQLIDFIIMAYSVIDYDASIQFFDTAGKMLLATNANTGSEFDLNEVFVGKNDSCYPKMSLFIASLFPEKDIHYFLTLPEEDRRAIYYAIKRKVDAHPSQIAKFLHLPYE